MGLQAYLLLAAAVFAIGLFGVLTRRNAVGILLGIELMLNAVNINLVAFSRFNGDLAGMVFALFTIAITVAEVAVGLAIVMMRSVDLATADRRELLLDKDRLHELGLRYEPSWATGTKLRGMQAPPKVAKE